MNAGKLLRLFLLIFLNTAHAMDAPQEELPMDVDCQHTVPISNKRPANWQLQDRPNLKKLKTKNIYFLDLPDEIIQTIELYISRLNFFKTASLICKAWKKRSDNSLKAIFFNNLTTDNEVKIFLVRCPKVVSLFLNFCENITDNCLSTLMNVTILDLDHNTVITDVGLRALTNLTTLYLDSNFLITDLSLLNLTNLTTLHLTNNRMITDAGLLHLPNLTGLSLKYNSQIKGEELWLLGKLRNLNLSCNKQVEDLYLSRLTNLTTLNLDMNNIITDSGVLPLTNLTKLSFYGNKSISEACLLTLTNLKNLDLDRYPKPF